MKNILLLLLLVSSCCQPQCKPATCIIQSKESHNEGKTERYFIHCEDKEIQVDLSLYNYLKPGDTVIQDKDCILSH